MKTSPSTRIDRSSALPLWAQVQSDITRRIKAGEFDAEFPGEHQLVTDYDVSRHTVRAALRELREGGLLEGGRGRPTRVAGREISQDQGTLYSLFSSVQRAGHSQRSEVRALEARADGVVARRLGLEESTPLIYLERLRFSDGEPLAFDQVWLPAQLASPLLDHDFSSTSVYAELERCCGVRLTGGREQVRALAADSFLSGVLDLPEQVAILDVERIGELRGRAVEYRRTYFRGDRFAFATDLSSPDRFTVTDGTGLAG